MATKLCLVFLLILLYLGIKIYPLTLDEAEDVKSLVLDGNSGRKQRDCQSETIYCSSRGDCVDICSNKNFVCNKSSNVCEPLIYEVVGESVKCNAAHGSYWALGVDEFIGEGYYCINRFPELFDENDKLLPHVCNGGAFDVDVTKKLPTLTDCKCPKSSELVYHESTPNVPRCIDKTLLEYMTTFHRV